jgi:tetratricopeptide (TPR) repeat protein
VNALALSNDGRTLVTGSGDKTARVWDLTSADPSANVRVLRGNDSSVNALALSSDGRTLVTGSDDKTARIWDLTTADPSANVRVLRGHNNNMNVLVLSRDGRTLVTGITDSAALVWALDLVQLASSACQQVGSNLSWTDWQLYFSDQPYQRTCPDLPVHPSVIAAAHDVAFAGNVDQAMVLFQQVLAFDPTIDLDPNTLMIDSDPQIVAKHIAAQGLIDKAGSQANDGTVDQVIVLLQQALTLNPTIDLDPNTPEIDHDPQIVAKHFAAQGLITKAGSQANDGTVDQVIVLFQQALALDPTIDLDPKTPVIDLDPQIVAKHIVAQGLIIKAVASGNDGRVDEAIDLFQQALTLDPTIDLDPITPTIDNNPQIVAQHIAAPALINKAVVLVNKGKIDEALANIAKVQQFDPIVPSSSYDNNSLCWFGSLWGAAERVMSFCEEGVRLAPEDAHIRDSRGLARALIEAKKGAKADYRGAIEDFNAYIAAGGSDEKIAQRKAWVAALSETPPRNPFDQQTLESLR